MEKNLRALNRKEKIAVWSEWIADYRSSGISPSSYYKWQKNLLCLASQSAPQFAEVCVAPAAQISATVHLDAVSVDIYLGADAETMAMVLRILQSC